MSQITKNVYGEPLDFDNVFIEGHEIADLPKEVLGDMIRIISNCYEAAWQSAIRVYITSGRYSDNDVHNALRLCLYNIGGTTCINRTLLRTILSVDNEEFKPMSPVEKIDKFHVLASMCAHDPEIFNLLFYNELESIIN